MVISRRPLSDCYYQSISGKLLRTLEVVEALSPLSSIGIGSTVAFPEPLGPLATMIGLPTDRRSLADCRL